MADDRLIQSSPSTAAWWSSNLRSSAAFNTGPSCSKEIGGGISGDFTWASLAADVGAADQGKYLRVSAESPRSLSNSSNISFQEAHHVQVSVDPAIAVAAAAPLTIDSTSQLMCLGLPSPTIDWNHSLLNMNSPASGRMENTSTDYFLQDLNQGFEQISPAWPGGGTLIDRTSAAVKSMIMNDPFEACIEESNIGVQYYSSKDSLHSNWNMSTVTGTSTAPASSCPVPNRSSTVIMNPISLNALDKRPMKMCVVEGVQEAESSSFVSTKADHQVHQQFKKPRIETPMPTFKVRKEKLGDRITALQQLVSPFGKTDTASVLHETIEYIKFLHDQVGVLSAPYLKSNGQQMQQQQGKRQEKSRDHSEAAAGAGKSSRDLRTRGLCLVPISSTFAVGTDHVPVDRLWSTPPPFGAACFR